MVTPEETNDVQDDLSVVEPETEAKAPRKRVRKAAPRKAAASKTKPAVRKRSKPAARPVAPPPPPLTLQELKQQGSQAKQELVSAVLEPALEAVGSLSQTIRDTIGGAFAGLLSRKRRGD
jgi:hypothetical protein